MIDWSIDGGSEAHGNIIKGLDCNGLENGVWQASPHVSDNKIVVLVSKTV